MSSLDQVLQQRLSQVGEAGLLRQLRQIEGPQSAWVTPVQGQPKLMLCSNNYLGLANHPALVQAAQQALQDYGCGSGASRLISGHMQLHAQLEERLARLKGSQAALVFSTGYQANLGVIQALMGEGDWIFSDALNHASLIDGCRLSRAQIKVYRHNDLDHLEHLLQQTPAQGQRLLVSDSVFSMDGDLVPLVGWLELAGRYGAWTMLDEAHATGVLGQRGAGLVEQAGCSGRVDIVTGTLGKALGGFGAFVTGSRSLIDWLINRARSFIFTTAPPPANLAMALAALDLLESQPELRQRLWHNVAQLQQGLSRLGLPVGQGQSPILPLVLGQPQVALDWAQALWQEGLWVQAIRPPTVAAGSSRLRITAMASLSHQDIELALQAFARVAQQFTLS